jgi:hypothetical protein
MTDVRHYGARQYVTSIKSSDMDWTTTLLLLSKYDTGLEANLKALGWKI